MTKYSIADIERLSGIKAHTVRMWEKRYNIVCPHRSEGNTRYYSEEDLKKMLNVAILNKKGIKISVIAKMCARQIETEAAKYIGSTDSSENRQDILIKAVVELDEYKINAIIDHCVQENGFSHTMEQVLYPLLESLSMMIITGGITAVQERFLVALIRRKLICAIDEEYRFIPEDAVRFLLYLPEGESHELSMLYVHLLLLEKGVLVLNLGLNMSVEEVAEANTIFNPTYVFTMLNESYMQTLIEPYVKAVAEHVGEATFLISGYAALTQHFDLPKNVEKIADIMDIHSYVQGKLTKN